MKALIYRELILCRKNLVMVIGFVGVAGFMLLVQLSFEIGNLSKLPPDMIEDMGEAIVTMMLYMPAMIGCMLGTICEVSVTKDLKPLWNRFRISTPISEWKFSAARCIVLTAATLVGYGLSLGYAALVCAIRGEAFTLAIFANITTILLATTLFTVLLQLGIMLLGSADKAGLVIIGLLMLIFAVITYLTDPKNNFEADILEKFSAAILPFSLLIFAALVAVNWAGTALLMKRREK